MIDFIVKNYIIIVVIAAFLIFALIGFAVDSAKNKNNKETDLLTKPNDEVDVNMIKEEPADEISSVTTEEISDADAINMDTDN